MRESNIIARQPNWTGVLICSTFQVSAHPSAVSFRWFFNNSEHQEWKDHGDFSQSGLKSQIEFLPKTSKDYGNLFCLAENAIGVQEQPCSFQIVPTGESHSQTVTIGCHNWGYNGHSRPSLSGRYNNISLQRSSRKIIKNKCTFYDVIIKLKMLSGSLNVCK